jgi:hypothetical protein
MLKELVIQFTVSRDSKRWQAITPSLSRLALPNSTILLSVAVAVVQAVVGAPAECSWQMTIRSHQAHQSQSQWVPAVWAVRETVLLLPARALIHLLEASQLSVVVAVEQVALRAQKLTEHLAEDQDTTAHPPAAVPVLQEPE